MDKGIRQGAIFKFNDLLPQLTALGGKVFRRAVLDYLVEQYGCTMNAAATHYNFAKHEAEKAGALAGVTLGRPPEKNNGGRKKKVAVEGGDAPAGDEEVDENADFTPEQTEFTVKRSKDGAVVAEGLSLVDAKALVEKAAAAKKAKLYWV